MRCGGVRNFEYTKGIRIEGTHQNVTDIAHFEKETIEKLSTVIEALSEDFGYVSHINPKTKEVTVYREEKILLFLYQNGDRRIPMRSGLT